MPEHKAESCLSEAYSQFTRDELNLGGLLLHSRCPVSVRFSTPGKRVTRQPLDAIVGEESARKNAVDRRTTTRVARKIQHGTAILVDLQAFRTHHARRRVKHRVTDVDHPEKPSVEQLPYRTDVVAATNEAGMPDLACLQKPVQSFKGTTRPGEMVNAQSRVVLALKRRPAYHGPIVNLQDVEVLNLEPAQGGLGGTNHMTGNVVEVARAYFDFRIQHRARLEALQHLAKVLFRNAVTVIWRSVEIRDTKIESAPDDSRLFVEIAADHQARITAAAETDLGHAEIGGAYLSVFHVCIPNKRSGYRARLAGHTFVRRGG
jgi:hypothetical protein